MLVVLWSFLDERKKVDATKKMTKKSLTQGCKKVPVKILRCAYQLTTLN